MALNLDSRQRAMLQEMGITVWLPKPAAPVSASSPIARAAPVVQQPTVAAAATARPAPAAPTTTPTPLPVPAVLTSPVTPKAVVEAATPSMPETAALAWRMAPAVQAFAQAAGGSSDDAWLVIWECDTPYAPLEGDSGKLLGNMLRALRLHHSRHVWIAGLQRPGHETLPVVGVPAQPVHWQPIEAGVRDSVQHIQPARILVLGMHAARAVLGRQDALGLLRAQVHEVHGIPTVVSYDPAYLLRSPHAKPAAWADLCRAHALRPPSHA